MPPGHPQEHRLLASFHRLAGEHNLQLAAWHWHKSTDPLSDLIQPPEPDAITHFKSGDYHSFCRAAGIRCLPYCPVCQSEGEGRNQSGG